MLNKITAFIGQHHLLRRGNDKYIVALSGGADSVALLLIATSGCVEKSQTVMRGLLQNSVE